MPISKIGRDRFTLSYSVLALAGCVWWQAAPELDERFDLFLALIPVIWLPVLSVVFTLVLVFFYHLGNGNWRRSASVVLACCLAWGFLEILPFSSVDWVKFQFRRSQYAAELSETGAADVSIKAWLFRDQGAFGSVVVETYIVYDESGEVALPKAQWSEAWKGKAINAGRPDPNFEYLTRPKDQWTPAGVGVQHIQGHWYFVYLSF